MFLLGRRVVDRLIAFISDKNESSLAKRILRLKNVVRIGPQVTCWLLVTVLLVDLNAVDERGSQIVVGCQGSRIGRTAF